MPTGYTAPIYEGKDITFEDFALRCARAFTTFILQRDDDTDVPPRPHFEPSTHYRDQINDLKVQIAELKDMTDEEIEAAAKAEAEEERVRYQKALEDDEAMSKRYTDMLAKAEAWQPSEKWANLKKFMIEQLHQSMEFDCGMSDYYKPKDLTPDDWYSKQMVEAERSLGIAQEQWAAEQSRTNERNEWARQLYVDLGLGVPA